MNDAMKAEMACWALSSAITRRVARGVALEAAEAKALTRMDSENVLTVSMLDAMMVSRPSSAGCPMLGMPAGSGQRLASAAMSATATAAMLQKVGRNQSLPSRRRQISCSLNMSGDDRPLHQGASIWRPAFLGSRHGLANDGLPLPGVGPADIAQVNLVVFSPQTGSGADIGMQTLDGGPFFCERA